MLNKMFPFFIHIPKTFNNIFYCTHNREAASLINLSQLVSVLLVNAISKGGGKLIQTTTVKTIIHNLSLTTMVEPWKNT